MKKIGDVGEVVAIRYLQKHGYKIMATNFKFGRFGEIDIVAQKESRHYFVEVKYRQNLNYGYPEESVTPAKLHKCIKTVEYYCKKFSVDFELIQFDVIAIQKNTKSYNVRHYKNIEI